MTLIILLFFTGIALSVTHTLWAYDLWWHLKTGEWIFQHHQVPYTNLYSFATPEYPWIDLSWLFQLLLYFSYHLLGINGIILLKVASVTGTFFLLFHLFYKKVDLFFLILTLTLVLYTAHERLVERPEVLSYFFLVFTLYLLEKDRIQHTRRIYLLPFVQLLWANSHALSIWGIVILGVECLIQIFSWFPVRRASPFPKRIFFLLMLSLFSSCINPYGLQGFLFPLKLFTRISGGKEFFTSEIGEFGRPLEGAAPGVTILLFKFLLFAGPFSFFWNRKNLREPTSLLFFVFAFLALLARRNIAPFAFLSSFVLLKNLEGVRIASPLRGGKRLASFVPLFTCLLLPLPFLTNLYYNHEGSGKRFGLGITENRYPTKVAQFVEKIKLRGNGFTSGLEIGDYFIWKFYPQLKVFVDGRLEAYPETFFEELFQTLNNPSRWPLWEKKYSLTFILLDHTNPKHQPLLSWLYRAPSWKPIYLDGQNVLFLKEREEYQEILSAYTIDLLKDPVPLLPGGPDAEVGVADFYAKLGILDKAEPLYRKNLPRLPHRAELHNNLGNLLVERGNPREALLEYQKAVALEPKNYLFRYNLGRLYTAMGGKKLALGELEKVVKLSPSFGGGHLILGMLYAETRRDEEAEKEFKRIRPSDVASLSARNALGVLYVQQGKLEEAERAFREVLERDPHAIATIENLKKLQRLRQK